ncbi:MAG: TrmH family RNA methyltransferase, partial [Petrimonas sp.]|nr:TrmH family RNA methyltransferase [Petrimonas sp.]
MKEKEMIFGIRAVIEAAEAGKDIDKVLVKRELSGELFKELQEVLRRCEIPMQKVPLERIDRITRKNHQGVIAFTSAVTYQKLDQIVPFLYEQGKNPLIVVLDGITDVRNFGAIARTCEVAGVDAIVIPARGSVSVNADAIKTSAGALHIIPVCRENSLKDAVVFLKNSGIRVVAATEKAAKNYTVADMSVPV